MPITIAQLVAYFGVDTRAFEAGAAEVKTELKAIDTQAAETSTALAKVGTAATASAQEAARAEEQLARASAQAMAALQRETALYGNKSRAAAAAYETERGALVGLTEADKARLVVMGQEYDKTVLLAQAQGRLAESRATAMAAAGRVGGDAALGVAALSGVAAKAAMDFEHMTQSIANNTTMTTADLSAMRSTILGMGKESGATFDDLAGGFMHIENFGFSATQATKVLDAAMKSAVSTGAQVSDTAEVLAKFLSAYHLGADQAERVQNAIHIAAAQGNMTLEQMNQSIGRIIGAAAGLNVPMKDLLATTATLTRGGMDSAEASTQALGMMTHIIRPTKEAIDALQSIRRLTGVDLVKDFNAGALAAKGMGGILADVKRAADGNADIVSRIFPNLRGTIGAIVLAGNGAESYRKIVGSIGDTLAGKTDPAQKAYTATMATAQQQFARLTREIEANLIPAGEKLLPTVERLIPTFKALADDAVAVVGAFSNLPQPVQEAVLSLGAARAASSVLGINLGGLDAKLLKLPASFRGMATAAGAATTAEGAMATEGAAAFAVGAPWMLAIGAAALAVWAIKKHWDDAKQAQADYYKYQGHSPTGGGAPGPLRPVDQIYANKAEAGRIGKSADYKNAVAAIGTYQAQIKQIESGGTAAYRARGATPEGAITAYAADLANAKKYLQQSVTLKAKMEHDMRALLGDAQRISSVQAGGVATAQGTSVGMAIAQAAYKRQLDGTAQTFVHHCEGLAHTTVGSVTSAYASIMDGAGSALGALNKFKAAGLAQPYTPGMALAPGSLLYSQTMGGKDGHVQTIGPQGQRLDQYGVNKFAPSNFQYYVPPPTESASRAAGGQRKGGITSAAIEADIAAHAQAEAAAKKAAKAHDEELKKGAEYLSNLQKEAALQGNTSKAAQVAYDIKHHLTGLLTQGQQAQALAAAKAYDALHKPDDKGGQYLADLRQQIALLGQDGKAAEINYQIHHGGIDGLTKAQEAMALSLARALDTSQKYHDAQAAINEQSRQLHETLDLGVNATDAQRMAWAFAHQSLSGLTAEQARAVRAQQAAIVVMQGQADAAAHLGDVLDTLKGINDDYAARAVEAAGGVKTATADAQKAIAETLAKARAAHPELNVNNPEVRAQAQGILSAAMQVDAQRAKTIQQDWLTDVGRTTAEAQAKISGTYTPATKAVEAWLKANKETIKELSALLGDARAAAVVGQMKAAVGNDATLQAAAEHLSAYRSQMADVQKQYDVMSASSPFDAWKASVLQYDQATNTLGEPFGDDDLKKLFAYQQELKVVQEVAAGAADVVMNALQGAFSPPQGKQEAKDSLLQMQRQAYDLQIKAFETQGQSQALGIANPYTQQLKTVQGQIDQTQAKLRGMGNSVGAVFGRVFSGIIGGFDQMIAKIALDALKAKVQQSLSSALAGVIGGPKSAGDTQAAAQKALTAQEALNAQFVAANTAALGAGGTLVPGMDALTLALNQLTAAMEAAGGGAAAGGSTGGGIAAGLTGILGAASGSPATSGLAGFGSYLGIGSTIAGALGDSSLAGLFGTASSVTSSAAGLLTHAPASASAPAPATAAEGGTTGALIPPAVINQTINILTPNAASFVQSKSQVAQAAAQSAASAQKKFGR